MLGGVEPVYRQESAELFEIVLTASEPYTLTTYHFADNECPDFDRDEDGIISRHPVDDDNLSYRLQTTRKRSNARCLGLIEVRETRSEKTFADPYRWFTVDFLHRTVRDFLHTKDIRDLLNKAIEPEFQAHKVLCEVFVRQLRYLRPPLSQEELKTGGIVEDLTTKSLVHARCVEAMRGYCLFEALEEHDETLSLFCREQASELYHAKRTSPLVTESFIFAALEKRLFVFAHEKLSRDPRLLKQESLKEYLLVLVLTQIPPSEHALETLPELTRLLVKAGGRPFTHNTVYPTRPGHPQYLLQSRTYEAPLPWDQFLDFIRDHWSEVSKHTISVWIRVAESLIIHCNQTRDHIRDLSAYVLGGQGTDREKLLALFPHNEVAQLLELSKLRTLPNTATKEEDEEDDIIFTIPTKKSILDWVPHLPFG